MRDTALLLGRLGLVALYFESAIGKFGNLDGVAVALGLYTRIAALGLVIFTVFAIAFFHDFWAVEAAFRQPQFLHFMKNLGLAGGLLVISGVGAGDLSVDGRRARRKLGRDAERKDVTQ